MAEVSDEVAKILTSKIKKAKFGIKSVLGSKEGTVLLMITAKRKRTDEVIKIIRSFDENVEIMTESIKIVKSHL